jgi:hypothetical protein
MRDSIFWLLRIESASLAEAMQEWRRWCALI